MQLCMIPKSLGLLFYLKKPRGYAKGERPIYLRITVDGVPKEMSIQRSWDPVRWNPDTGRAAVNKASARRTANKQQDSCTPESEALALNAYRIP